MSSCQKKVIPLQDCFGDVCKRKILNHLPGYDWMGRGRFVVLNDGTWVMTYQEGTRHSSNGTQHCNIAFSDDQGLTWSKPNTTLKGEKVDPFPIFGADGKSSTQNSFLTKVGSKLILIVEDRQFHSDTVRYRYSFLGHYRYESNDGGKTWSEPMYLSDQFEGSVQQQWAVYYAEVVDNEMYISITVTDGDFLKGDFLSRAKCILYKSSDYGISWSKISDITNYKDATYEGAVAYLGGDSLVFAARSRGTENDGFIIKRSPDLGKTWSNGEIINYLDGGLNQPYVKWIADYDRLYIFGRARRSNCHVNNFCNWSNSIYWLDSVTQKWHQKDLHLPVGGDAGYTQCIVLDDGNMRCIGNEGKQPNLEDSNLYVYSMPVE